MDPLQAINSNPVVREALARIPVSQEPLYVGERILTPKQLLFSNQRYRVFYADYMELTLDTLRALDAQAKEIRTEETLAEISLDEHALKCRVDQLLIDEAGAFGVDYIAEQLAVIRERLLLAKEYRLLMLLFTAANYDAAHKLTTPANFIGATIAQLKAIAFNAADAIAASTGMPPNFAALGRQALRDLRQNPNLLAVYDLVTDAVLAEVLDVPEIIPVRSGYKTTAGAFTPFADSVALFGIRTLSESEPLSDNSIGRTAYIPYGGQRFDTRQTPPQGVERLIEAGIFTRYRPALANSDAGYLASNTNAV